MATTSTEVQATPNEQARPIASVAEQVVAIVADMVDDWGLDVGHPIGFDTYLHADLECCSVDIIHLIVAIEEHFSCPRMGFHELVLRDNRYVDDLTVGQLAEFVARKVVALKPASSKN
jgi:acyl carrier protein